MKMRKTYNYNKYYTLKLFIIIFIKFRRYTTPNVKNIMKFNQIVGRIQILLPFCHNIDTRIISSINPFQ